MQNHQETQETKKLDKEVEKILYEYPMWKVNLKHCRLYENKKCATSGWKPHHSRVAEIAISRAEYQENVELVEEALSSFTILEQNFINCRYFKKMPFKIIAEELAVVERHLYRIRRKVIKQFGLALGR